MSNAITFPPCFFCRILFFSFFVKFLNPKRVWCLHMCKLQGKIFVSICWLMPFLLASLDLIKNFFFLHIADYVQLCPLGIWSLRPRDLCLFMSIAFTFQTFFKDVTTSPQPLVNDRNSGWKTKNVHFLNWGWRFILVFVQ